MANGPCVHGDEKTQQLDRRRDAHSKERPTSCRRAACGKADTTLRLRHDPSCPSGRYRRRRSTPVMISIAGVPKELGRASVRSLLSTAATFTRPRRHSLDGYTATSRCAAEQPRCGCCHRRSLQGTEGSGPAPRLCFAARSREEPSTSSLAKGGSARHGEHPVLANRIHTRERRRNPRVSHFRIRPASAALQR